jgi:hypothetical protein
MAVLGDDPKHVAIEPIGHRCDSRLATLATGRLQQSSAATTKADAVRHSRSAIDHPHSQHNQSHWTRTAGARQRALRSAQRRFAQRRAMMLVPAEEQVCRFVQPSIN